MVIKSETRNGWQIQLVKESDNWIVRSINIEFGSYTEESETDSKKQAEKWYQSELKRI